MSRTVLELLSQIAIIFKNHHNNVLGLSSLISSFPADKMSRANQASRTTPSSFLLHLPQQTQSFFFLFFFF